MTPTQTQTVAALLGVDLTSVDSDRLIELCILHRSNPKALETFPTALKSELERRFDDAAIRADDVSFAVLEKFSNEFQSAIPFFAIKLREMAATVNRDIWFADNEAVFKSGLNDADVAAWIAKDADILTKILHNDVALPWVAQSETASKAILTRAESLALWKDTPKLWQVWPQHAAGMGVIAQSGELAQYVIDTPAALSAVIASSTAMNAVIASSTAMNAVAASSTAMNAVIASSTAMNAVIASSTAMNAVAASSTAMTIVSKNQSAMTAMASNSTAMVPIASSSVAMNIVAASSVAMGAFAAKEPALRAIVNQQVARDALVANNDKLQAVRETMYNTVKTVWRKAYSSSASSPSWVSNYNANLTGQGAGLVFACLGYYNGQSSNRSSLHHPNDALAGSDNANSPTSMTRVSAVSFDSAKIKPSDSSYNNAYSYGELLVPQ